MLACHAAGGGLDRIRRLRRSPGRCAGRRLRAGRARRRRPAACCRRGGRGLSTKPRSRPPPRDRSWRWPRLATLRRVFGRRRLFAARRRRGGPGCSQHRLAASPASAAGEPGRTATRRRPGRAQSGGRQQRDAPRAPRGPRRASARSGRAAQGASSRHALDRPRERSWQPRQERRISEPEATMPGARAGHRDPRSPRGGQRLTARGAGRPWRASRSRPGCRGGGPLPYRPRRGRPGRGGSGPCRACPWT